DSSQSYMGIESEMHKHSTRGAEQQQSMITKNTKDLVSEKDMPYMDEYHYYVDDKLIESSSTTNSFSSSSCRSLRHQRSESENSLHLLGLATSGSEINIKPEIKRCNLGGYTGLESSEHAAPDIKKLHLREYKGFEDFKVCSRYSTYV